MIEGSGGDYQGGTGVVIRNPFDGYEDGGDFKYDKDFKLVGVPSTFWSNDVFAPSQVFPASCGTTDDWGIDNNPPGLTGFNVDCPNDSWNGYWSFEKSIQCETDPGTGFDKSMELCVNRLCCRKRHEFVVPGL